MDLLRDNEKDFLISAFELRKVPRADFGVDLKEVYKLARRKGTTIAQGRHKIVLFPRNDPSKVVGFNVLEHAGKSIEKVYYAGSILSSLFPYNFPKAHSIYRNKALNKPGLVRDRVFASNMTKSFLDCIYVASHGIRSFTLSELGDLFQTHAIFQIFFYAYQQNHMYGHVYNSRVSSWYLYDLPAPDEIPDTLETMNCSNLMDSLQVTESVRNAVRESIDLYNYC